MDERARRQAISLYFPIDDQARGILKRLQMLAQKKDRSVNYLVVEAIVQYLDQHEAKLRNS